MDYGRQPLTNFEIIASAVDIGQISEVLKTTAETMYEEYPELYKELRINETIEMDIFEHFKSWLIPRMNEENCSEQVLITITISDTVFKDEQGTFMHIHAVQLSNNASVYTSEEICKEELKEFYRLKLD